MNWQNIIKELQAAGFSQPQIAARCECSQASISALSIGKTKEPNFTLGQKIMAMHKLFTPKKKQAQEGGE